MASLVIRSNKHNNNDIIDELDSFWSRSWGHRTYEVLSTTITNNWLKHLITGRKTEVAYYIRRTATPYGRKSKIYNCLSYDRGIFSFKQRDSMVTGELILWDNPDTPASLIVAAKLRTSQVDEVDEVVFSSDDL
jgi:hypothetical protein